MHDLVGDVANRIMVRDNSIISSTCEDELKDWPNKDLLQKCTAISFPFTVIPCLPDVLECPELKMFILWSRDVTLEIPCNIFGKMEKLKVLDLTKLSFLPSLPPSLKFLKSLKTLCLDHCKLGDLALVGQLDSLEFLSFQESDFKQLPKEIGQLTRLRFLNLNGCSQLELISPNVLSRLKRLEDLRMGNSFTRWEVEGVISIERSNANLGELKHLHQLTALQLHIPDDVFLPVDLFTTKLETFQICIGSAWKWADVDQTLNVLKLKLTTSNELDQGLKMLLKRTEDLYLEGMDGVNNNILYELGTEGFLQLKHLHLQNNAAFACIINGKVGFPNLTWLEVSGLNDIRFLLSSSMARSLAQLKHLQISGCQIMEAIVSTEESDEIADKLFCQLQDLELKDLPKLTKFCSRDYTKVSNPSSGRLQLEDCIKRHTICEEIEEIDSTGNLDIVIQHFLFDNKVEFPNLKKLSIDGLAKLRTIWSNQFSLESSKNLETMKVVSCDSLKSVFPASLARSLQQLRSLIVQKCGVEEIVAREERLQTTPKFVFPNVTRVTFKELSQLTSFYPGMHVSSWPSLKDFGVYSCYKVNILAKEISSFQGHHEQEHFCSLIPQPLFLVEKYSFPSLEWLILNGMDIWNGPLPVQLFNKLKLLDVAYPLSKSVVFLEKLINPEGNRSRSVVGIGTQQLPNLKVLRLIGMEKLMHLGPDDEEDNSQSALRIPNFPNLEILSVNWCHSLRNLRSSAISFKNLTNLRVTVCKGLKYLITYSMAESLMQLRALEVEVCPRLVEIVGSNEDDDSRHEITFMGLKLLKLSDLPTLQSFCSGNCIAKFPSLQTLIMSNRLKSKIFPGDDETLQLTNEGEDTDVDFWEAWLATDSTSTDSMS